MHVKLTGRDAEIGLLSDPIQDRTHREDAIRTRRDGRYATDCRHMRRSYGFRMDERRHHSQGWGNSGRSGGAKVREHDRMTREIEGGRGRKGASSVGKDRDSRSGKRDDDVHRRPAGRAVVKKGPVKAPWCAT